MWYENRFISIIELRWYFTVSDVSPGEGGFEERDVTDDLVAVPEGFDVGGVDGNGIAQNPDPNAVTRWWRTETRVIFLGICVSSSESVVVSTFGTAAVAVFTALDSVLLHLVCSRAAGTDA